MLIHHLLDNGIDHGVKMYPLYLSNFQTKISLSITEAKYIALSHSMREAIPMMTLLE